LLTYGPIAEQNKTPTGVLTAGICALESSPRKIRRMGWKITLVVATVIGGALAFCGFLVLLDHFHVAVIG
jgi:hypothetical protein